MLRLRLFVFSDFCVLETSGATGEDQDVNIDEIALWEQQVIELAMKFR